MNQSTDNNSIGICEKKHRRYKYKKIKHFRKHKCRKITKKPSRTSVSDEILMNKSSEESSSQHSNLNTLSNIDDDNSYWDEPSNKRSSNNKLDYLEGLDKRQHDSAREILQLYKSVNDKLSPEIAELEFVEFINEYGEMVYLQRRPIQLENHIIQSGFLFLSSPCLHWGEILTVRDVYVIDGSGSIICKDLKSNTKEDFFISKGENFVLIPGCTIEFRKDSDTMLLKLFIVYM